MLILTDQEGKQQWERQYRLDNVKDVLSTEQVDLAVKHNSYYITDGALATAV